MKKIILIFFICFACIVYFFVFGFLMVPEDEVISSLGKYEKEEYFTSGGFQDFTDYAKYSFANVNIEENEYLKKIEYADFEVINKCLEDFETWIETIKDSEPTNEVVVNYDFDNKIIDIEDYFYLELEEYIWSDGNTLLENYNVYLFDVQTNVLYYFHNNI